MDIFAILGHNTPISLAEIRTATGYVPTWQERDVAVFIDVSWNFSVMQQQLGGMQKCGTIIASVTKDTPLTTLAEFLTADLEVAHSRLKEKRLDFGLSLYGDVHQVKSRLPELHRLGMTIKKSLKAAGYTTRLVASQDPALSSVVINKNNLLDSGAEYVIILQKDALLIGRTESVQDVDEWSRRDVGKPYRNAKQGMLPPKLARMMLNLAGMPLSGKTILDPFCGSGTILMEAAMLNAAHIIGGDVNGRAIDDTRNNLTWLLRSISQQPTVTLHVSPAQHLPALLSAHSVDLIVTEPFLGTPRQGTETEEEVRQSVLLLEELFKKSFTALQNTLAPGARLVIANPVHFVGTTQIAPRLIDIMTSVGCTPLPYETPTKYGLLYHRPGQFVGRELLIFKKER